MLEERLSNGVEKGVLWRCEKLRCQKNVYLLE